MKNTKTKLSQRRAVKVNHNYGTVKKTIVLGGEKAGRFAVANITIKKQRKNSTRRTRRSTRGIDYRTIKSIFRMIFSMKFVRLAFYVIFFAWICSAICETYIKPSPKVEVQSSIPIIGTLTTSFESADQPSNYKEPDSFDKYFGKDAKIIRAICKAENGRQDPKIISKINRNGTYDYGLCQINSIHLDHVGGDFNKLLDSDTNIRVAHEVYMSQGWTAWTCYKNGSYLKHL